MKFEENDIAITVQKYQKTFIYFLLKNDIVMYVGQTRQGLVRPLSHRGKEFDTIKIIYCDDDELDILEDKYIMKYKPKYNKTYNQKMNYSLRRAKDNIRELFNNDINLLMLKKIINELDIEIYSINGNQYVKRYDFQKIVDYLKYKETKKEVR